MSVSVVQVTFANNGDEHASCPKKRLTISVGLHHTKSLKIIKVTQNQNIGNSLSVGIQWSCPARAESRGDGVQQARVLEPNDIEK